MKITKYKILLSPHNLASLKNIKTRSHSTVLGFKCYNVKHQKGKIRVPRCLTCASLASVIWRRRPIGYSAAFTFIPARRRCYCYTDDASDDPSGGQSPAHNPHRHRRKPTTRYIIVQRIVLHISVHATRQLDKLLGCTGSA